MAYCYRHPNRETGLSCSECGRPICTECMTPAPVGLRCPEHSGRPSGPQRLARAVRLPASQAENPIVTQILIGVNVVVWFVMLAQGASIGNSVGSTVFDKGALYGPAVANGDWWRLITSAFLHASLIHIGFNMLGLWWFGAPVERALGHARYLLLYVVSGLAGSAGALIDKPLVPTVGASGAIFGILGAALVLERQRTYVLGGSALTVILINLVFTFTISNIAIGGHLGGLAGGILGTLALSRFGRGHAAYGRVGLVGVAGLVAVGIASVVVAYLKVRGYAA